MKIAGKEISNEISLGTIISILIFLSSIWSGVWLLSAKQQFGIDATQNLTIRTENLSNRIERLEQSQTEIARNSATAAATAVAAVNTVVDRNEARRDASDAAMRAAIDRLTDRINQISDALAGRQHGELSPLTHLAENAPAEISPWNLR